ncbi:MAG: hypothetical protein V4722_26725 [Bacteroidota bacterium]
MDSDAVWRYDKKWPWKLLGIIAFASILYFVVGYQNKATNKKLLKHAAFTTTQFTGESVFAGRPKSLYYICYYEINGKKYSSSEPTRLCDKLGADFFKEKFSVIYDSTKPEVGRVLVFPFEFEELGLEYPERLNWIKKIEL